MQTVLFLKLKNSTSNWCSRPTALHQTITPRPRQTRHMWLLFFIHEFFLSNFNVYTNIKHYNPVISNIVINFGCLFLQITKINIKRNAKICTAWWQQFSMFTKNQSLLFNIKLPRCKHKWHILVSEKWIPMINMTEVHHFTKFANYFYRGRPYSIFNWLR